MKWLSILFLMVSFRWQHGMKVETRISSRTVSEKYDKSERQIIYQVRFVRQYKFHWQLTYCFQVREKYM